jgi:hypothetical protein
MLIYTTQRPSVLPAAQCASSTAAWRPGYDSVVAAAAGRVRLSQAHQVQAQSELALILTAAGGSNGTNGFRGSKGVDSAKRMTVDASGVPPRGRPV